VKAESANYFDAGVSQRLLPGLTVGIDAYYKVAHHLIDEGQFGAPIILTAFNYERGDVHGIELTMQPARRCAMPRRFSISRKASKPPSEHRCAVSKRAKIGLPQTGDRPGSIGVVSTQADMMHRD